MKRIISLILVLTLVLSVSLSSVSADTTSTTPKFIVTSVQGEIGETVDVKISLENNPGITALQMNVGYSSDDLELISIEDAGLFNDSLSHSKLTKNPLIVSWYSSSSSDEAEDGCFATLKFKILENASNSEVVVTYNEDNIFDSSFNNVKFDVVNGTVKVNSDPCHNGHTVVVDNAVPPTCTKTGLTEGSHCSVCNTVLVEQEIVDIVDHNYVNGSCTYCGTTLSTPRFVVTSVQGEIGETVDVKISLENNPGITALQMNVSYSSDDLELVSIEDAGLFNDSLSHSKLTKNPLIVSWYSSSSSDEAEDGCFATLKFKVLDNASDSEVVVTYNEDNIFDSSFNNIKFDVVNGTVRVIGGSCYDGHTIVVDDAVPATCTKSGLTEGSHCSVCNTVITKQEIVPALGHNYVDGVCANCGEKSCPYTYVVLDDNTIKITKYIGDDSEVIIPSTIDGYKVSVIGDSAFRENTIVTSVVIPEGITKIGSWAFYGCESMTKVTLPSTITSVGSNAFHSCSALKACNFTGTTDDWCGITFDNYYSNPLANGQYFYINDKLVSEIIIKDGTTEIKKYTFVGCRSVSKITIPNSVKTIEKYALCNLDECYFLGTVEEWCKINFEDSTSSPTYHGADLYIDGELLTELIVPDSISAINNHAFMYCRTIKSITLGSEVKTIGDYAFNNCTGVETVSISSDVISIGKCAFLNCSKITNVKLPETIESIGEKAFYNCSGLKSITIPSSVKNIDFAAFSGNSSLEHILCVGTEEEWKSTTIESSNTPITSTTIHFADTDGYTSTPPTCTNDGCISYKCPVCSYEMGNTIYTPATGHTEVIDKGYAPTDTKPGLTDGSHCAVCNEIIVKQEVIPMLAGMLGDANLDGKVNILDVTAIQMHLAQLEDFSDKQLAVSDANKDGKVNISDATHIQMFLAQLIPKL